MKEYVETIQQLIFQAKYETYSHINQFILTSLHHQLTLLQLLSLNTRQHTVSTSTPIVVQHQHSPLALHHRLLSTGQWQRQIDSFFGIPTRHNHHRLIVHGFYKELLVLRFETLPVAAHKGSVVFQPLDSPEFLLEELETQLLWPPGDQLQLPQMFRPQVDSDFLAVSLRRFILFFLTNDTLSGVRVVPPGEELFGLQVKLTKKLSRRASEFGDFRAVRMFFFSDQSLVALVLPSLQTRQIEFMPSLKISYLQQDRLFSFLIQLEFEKDRLPILTGTRLYILADSFDCFSAGFRQRLYRGVPLCLDFYPHLEVAANVTFFDKGHSDMSKIVLQLRFVDPDTALIVTAKVSLQDGQLPDILRLLPVLNQRRTTYQHFLGRTFLIAVQNCKGCQLRASIQLSPRPPLKEKHVSPQGQILQKRNDATLVTYLAQSNILYVKASDGLKCLNYRQCIEGQIAAVDLSHSLLQDHGPDFAPIRQEHRLPPLFNYWHAFVDLYLFEDKVMIEVHSVLLRLPWHGVDLVDDFAKKPREIAKSLIQDQVVFERELTFVDVLGFETIEKSSFLAFNVRQSSPSDLIVLDIST